MVKINHPDLFKTPKDKAKATQKMLKINEAYKMLSEYLQYRECCLQI
jgi:DnaJ-class molecular chaperone